MQKLLVIPAALFAGMVTACAPSLSSSDQLVGYLSSAAPPEVEILSAKCDDQTGVCSVDAASSFHSPELATVGYWCRVSTAGGFVAECPGVRWLEGSRGTPINDSLAELLIPGEGASVQEPCAGLSNTELLFCLHRPVGG